LGKRVILTGTAGATSGASWRHLEESGGTDHAHE
jgi:hypothetical protein